MSLDIIKSFISKMRDLSNNLDKVGESSKKQRKLSLNYLSVSHNIAFVEELKSPECVSILFKCFQNLEKKK